MIDTVKARKDGTPQATLLTRSVTLSIRIGTAAYFAGKQADDMLGRYGHWMKYFFEFTRGKNVVLRAVLKRRNARNLIGIGGQYIVLQAQDPVFIEKYSHTLAGADPKILMWVLSAHRHEHETMRGYFGDMLQATEYDLATLPIRGPAKHLITLRARQQNLTKRVDLFSDDVKFTLQSAHGTRLRKDIQTLLKQTRKAMIDNVWLDIIGPENVVIVDADTNPRIRIIDIEPYVPEYLAATNPMTNKTYKETFLERLTKLEQLAKS